MLIITFLSLVIDLLGFTVILPLFPSLLEYYSKNDSSGLYYLMQQTISSFRFYLNIPKNFDTVLFGGFLGSLFSLLQFLSSPITGALSDVYGRKPIYILTLIGISLSYGLWSVASNFTIFLLSRVIGGISKGNVSLAYSIMTDISDAVSRSKGMALIGVAFSIGFIIGPIVGVGFAKWGSTGWFSASALYALSLALLNILFTVFFFKETLPQKNRKKSLHSGYQEMWNYISPRRLFTFTALNVKTADRCNLNTLGIIYFFYLFVYSGLEFTITFVTHYIHNYDSMAQGKMFAYLGLTMAIVQGGYVRRIKKGHEKNMVLSGFCLMIPAFLLIGLSSHSSHFLLLVGLMLYSIGSSLLVPCLTSLASSYGSESEKGTLLGIWRSLGALARAFGPIAACFGFWCLGSAWTYGLGGLSLFIPLFLLKSL